MASAGQMQDDTLSYALLKAAILEKYDINPAAVLAFGLYRTSGVD